MNYILFICMYGFKMSESLLSSADFSDLSDMEDNTVVVTPPCPICRVRYSSRVKPVTLQPCGHGCCRKCLTELSVRVQIDEYGVPVEPKCPLCREPIAKDTPNFALREITSNVNNDQKVGFWEKQIMQLDTITGRKISFSREMRSYAKVVCLRIAYDDVIIGIKLESKAWNNAEVEAIQAIQNGIIHVLLKTDDEMDVLCKWIGLLAFPIVVETYLLKYFIQWYDNKDFLQSIEGLWLMDVITHPV
jgi:hypothetical protein